MDKILIAVIGKTIGLKGELRLNLLSDFDSQFKKGAKFKTDRFDELEIERYNSQRGLIKFIGFDTPEDARKLINQKIYTTKEQTKETIKLKDGEFFWFDIIGLDVIDSGKRLGRVIDIERYNVSDYLIISTDKSLEGMPKRFLVPYIDRYVLDVSLEAKEIYTKDAIDILESS
jgi:16S rRNA processing protein RimM